MTIIATTQTSTERYKSIEVFAEHVRTLVVGARNGHTKVGELGIFEGESFAYQPATKECCEQYWTSPGGNIPQGTNYTATCLPSRKLSKLDEPDTQDTAGGAGTSS